MYIILTIPLDGLLRDSFEEVTNVKNKKCKDKEYN